jgi:hypothetical protein
MVSVAKPEAQVQLINEKKMLRLKILHLCPLTFVGFSLLIHAQEFLLTDRATKSKCLELKGRVNAFAAKFPIPGHEEY